MSNRQILDVIGVTQEWLHTTKTKNLSSTVMKIDPDKDYDKVNWNFLSLVLLQIGLPIELTNWIMACISSINFSILVNGSATTFFKGHKELGQGFPLSPLMFLLVIKGLIRLICEAKKQEKKSKVYNFLHIFQ